MATQNRGSVIGVFTDHSQAQRAVSELKRAGFTDDQIGVVGRDERSGDVKRTAGDSGEETDSYAGEGAATGLAAGAGVGALWGLGILAGALPAIGPAIAGGTLAALLSSAAAGAAAAGLGGALIGMGIPKDEAEYYETEVNSGRIIVTVSATGRDEEARAILRRNGGYDASNRQSSSMNATSNTAAALSSQGTMAGSSAAGAGTVQAVEEQLHARKERVQTGEVNIRKEVHTEQKTLEVPVTREEVVIERRTPTSGTASAADIGQHQQIRIPVSEEQITVEKTPVVKEEVAVHKRQVQDTERVTGTVRSEEIVVERDNDTNASDGGSCAR
jgi:uncharacterized protein (TIGR02271 family)